MNARKKVLVGLTALALLAVSVPAWAAEEGGEGGFPGELAFKWINFAILFGALGYFAWKHLPAFFASRAQSIRHGLEEAARGYEESRRRLAEIEQHLAQLDSEIEQLRQAAAADQIAEHERIRSTGRAEGEKVLAAARAEIEATARAARLELKAYTGRMAVELAASQIRQQMTPARQTVLFEQYVRNLGGV